MWCSLCFNVLNHFIATNNYTEGPLSIMTLNSFFFSNKSDSFEMKIVIIEDEEITSQALTEYIKTYDVSYDIVATLRSIKDALSWFTHNAMPDLIFSDIELLDGNVFTFYEKISISCPIIFTTAYDNFLLKAFQINGIAYILKPFGFAQVSESFDKYFTLKSTFSGTTQPHFSFVEQLKNALKPTFKQRFTVKMKNGISLLNVQDIVYLQADEGLVFAFGINQQKYPLNGTLSDINDLLDPSQFFRINRSEIINIQYIEKMEAYFNDRLTLKTKGMSANLIVSTARTPDFRKWVEG
jgi:two-component system, LytTR family, response regulator LytT